MTVPTGNKLRLLSVRLDVPCCTAEGLIQPSHADKMRKCYCDCCKGLRELQACMWQLRQRDTMESNSSVTSLTVLVIKSSVGKSFPHWAVQPRPLVNYSVKYHSFRKSVLQLVVFTVICIQLHLLELWGDLSGPSIKRIITIYFMINIVDLHFFNFVFICSTLRFPNEEHFMNTIK